LLHTSCVSQDTLEPAETPVIAEEPAPAPEPEPEPVAEISPEQNEVHNTDAEEINAVETEAEEPPESEIKPENEENIEDFVVTEDVFKKTFNDIENLIKELNTIIQSEDYKTWTTYLTEGYRNHLEDPEVLAELSEEPVLKKYNVNLKSLQDYFYYVVVPSRSNARLDDLVFIDNTRVKAIMIIKNQRSILYKLEWDGNSWKIGVF